MGYDIVSLNQDFFTSVNENNDSNLFFKINLPNLRSSETNID